MTARNPIDMLWLAWSAFASLSALAPAGSVLQIVHFDGNRAVATAALEAAAERLGPALSGDDGPERLALAVTQVYFDDGYVAVRVDEPVRAPDGSLVVHVSEGPRFYMRAISFTGAWPRADAELRALVRTRAGDAFSRARLIADIARLSSTVPGAITPLTRLDVDHHTVDLELTLERAKAEAHENRTRRTQR